MPHRFSDVSICATYTKTLIMSNVLETKNALKKRAKFAEFSCMFLRHLTRTCALARV